VTWRARERSQKQLRMFQKTLPSDTFDHGAASTTSWWARNTSWQIIGPLALLIISMILFALYD